MSDCWKILGLAPTVDLAAIKRAYREQVKLYHPDTVATPEQKRRYTIICAGINDAYREAVRRAQAASSAQSAQGDTNDEASADAPYPTDAEFAEADEAFRDAERGNSSVEGFRRFFKSPSALRTILFVFFGFEMLVFFNGPARHVPVAAQTMAGIFIALFIGFVIYGLLVAGAIDFLIFWFFPRRLLDRLGLAKYESKIVWFVLAAVNISIFFFTKLIPHPGHEKAAVILDMTVRAAASGTIPLGLVLFWLRDLIRYRRINQSIATV